ncbi:Mitogen-activated protein kinase kinase kinase 3 [Diplonema papillatum]|nr:Mitogen-activated protein kinase kinase kinase 3 [Diplonema papillatum]
MGGKEDLPDPETSELQRAENARQLNTRLAENEALESVGRRLVVEMQSVAWSFLLPKPSDASPGQSAPTAERFYVYVKLLPGNRGLRAEILEIVCTADDTVAGLKQAVEQKSSLKPPPVRQKLSYKGAQLEDSAPVASSVPPCGEVHLQIVFPAVVQLGVACTIPPHTLSEDAMPALSVLHAAVAPALVLTWLYAVALWETADAVAQARRAAEAGCGGAAAAGGRAALEAAAAAEAAAHAASAHGGGGGGEDACVLLARAEGPARGLTGVFRYENGAFAGGCRRGLGSAAAVHRVLDETRRWVADCSSLADEATCSAPVPAYAYPTAPAWLAGSEGKGLFWIHPPDVDLQYESASLGEVGLPPFAGSAAGDAMGLVVAGAGGARNVSVLYVVSLLAGAGGGDGGALAVYAWADRQGVAPAVLGRAPGRGPGGPWLAGGGDDAAAVLSLSARGGGGGAATGVSWSGGVATCFAVVEKPCPLARCGPAPGHYRSETGAVWTPAGHAALFKLDASDHLDEVQATAGWAAVGLALGYVGSLSILAFAFVGLRRELAGLVQSWAASVEETGAGDEDKALCLAVRSRTELTELRLSEVATAEVAVSTFIRQVARYLPFVPSALRLHVLHEACGELVRLFPGAVSLASSTYFLRTDASLANDTEAPNLSKSQLSCLRLHDSGGAIDGVEKLSSIGETSSSQPSVPSTPTVALPGMMAAFQLPPPASSSNGEAGGARQPDNAVFGAGHYAHQPPVRGLHLPAGHAPSPGRRRFESSTSSGGLQRRRESSNFTTSPRGSIARRKSSLLPTSPSDTAFFSVEVQHCAGESKAVRKKSVAGNTILSVSSSLSSGAPPPAGTTRRRSDGRPFRGRNFASTVRVRRGTVLCIEVDVLRTHTVFVDQHVKLSNNFVRTVCDVAKAFDGVVLTIGAGSVLCSWNCHNSIPQHCLYACHAALDMSAQLVNTFRDLRVSWSCGVASGNAYVGQSGTVDQKTAFIAGEPVALSKKLAKLALRVGAQVLVNEAIFDSVQAQMALRIVDCIRAPRESVQMDSSTGREEDEYGVCANTQPGVTAVIYELIGLRSVTKEVSPEMYLDAFGLFRSHKFRNAAVQFREFLALNPGHYQAYRLFTVSTFLDSCSGTRVIPKPYYRQEVGFSDFESESLPLPPLSKVKPVAVPFLIPRATVSEFDSPTPSVSSRSGSLLSLSNNCSSRLRRDFDAAKSGLLTKVHAVKADRADDYSVASSPQRSNSIMSSFSSQSRESGCMSDIPQGVSSASVWDRDKWATPGNARKEVEEDSPPVEIYDAERKECWWRSDKKLAAADGSTYQALSKDGSIRAVRFVKLSSVADPLSSSVKTARSNRIGPRESPSLPHTDPGTSEVLSEIALLSSLRHGNIVAYVGCAVCGKYLAVCFEFMAGGPLETVLEQFRTLSVPCTVRYLKDILRGAKYLHGNGVVHADLCPSNVLLGTDGTCKITNFYPAGLAKLSGKKGPAYLAPESADTTQQAASDIWSIGIMTIRMLTGELPYSVNDADSDEVDEFLDDLAHGIVRPVLPELPQYAGAFVQACLQEEPSDRPTAESLLFTPLLNIT